MKSILTTVLFFCLCTFGFSQTSKHVEIIKSKETLKSTLLLETARFETNKSFNTVTYSTELKQAKHLTSAFNTNISKGYKVIFINSLKRNAYKNFEINYRRTALDRLLPKPPDALNFCPQFSQ